jgi:hypothetical protein
VSYSAIIYLFTDFSMYSVVQNSRHNHDINPTQQHQQSSPGNGSAPPPPTLSSRGKACDGSPFKDPCTPPADLLAADDLDGKNTAILSPPDDDDGGFLTPRGHATPLQSTVQQPIKPPVVNTTNQFAKFASDNKGGPPVKPTATMPMGTYQVLSA